MPNAIILPVDKLRRVLQGQATTNDKNSFPFVKNLLTMLTDPTQCDTEHKVDSNDVLCVKPEENPKLKPLRNIKNYLSENKLQNIFDFIAAVIDGSPINIQSEIKKLLKLCSIFSEIDLSKSKLTLDQKNALNAAYVRMFMRIANLPKLLDISNEQDTNYQIVDLLNLTNNFFEAWAKLNINTEYSIFESLKDYTQSIGNLTRNVNVDYVEGRDISPIETQMARLIDLLTPYLNADQKKVLMYTFAHEYKSGDELTVCNEVFSITDCDPYRVTKEFLEISNGYKSYNSKISLDENLDLGLRLLKKLKFDSTSFKSMEANTKSLNNFSQYFKVLIKKINEKGQTLPDDFTNYLFEFLSYQFNVFRGTDTLLMSYRSAFSLFLALLKNPSAKNNPLIIHYIEQAFNPMEILLNSVMVNSSKNNTLGIISTLEIFADMVHLAVNDVSTITFEEKKAINLKISGLIKVCFKLDGCPSSSALDQFFNSLGSMVRNLSKKTKGDQEKQQALTIQQTTQQLIENARNNSIPLSRIGNLAYAYLNGRYDQKVDAINRDCEILFNLEECHPAHPVDRTVENHTDFIIHKTTPAIPQVNTTLVSAINQTSTPDLIDNKTTIALPENVNHTFSNQTIDQTTPSNKSHINVANPGPTLGASAAHGVGSGMINGIIQYFATKYSRHGEQSSRAKALVIYSSLLAHATLAATFPMMLFKIQEYINQGNEDEAQQLWDVLLLNALPTFIGSVVTNCGYHLACELSQSFSKRLHTLTQNIPLVATACNLYSNPMETGIHLATSFATSSLTYIGLNKFFPVKSSPIFNAEANTQVKYDVQANDIEIQPLNQRETTSFININGSSKDSSPAEIFFEKVQFTNSKQFNNLKQYLKGIINDVEELKDKLSDQQHCNRLEIILDIPDSQQGLRYDLKDLEGFPQKFETEYNKCINEDQKSAVLRNNLDYFKTMIKTIYDKLMSDNINDDCIKDILCSIETKSLKNNIKEVIASIKDNLSFIRAIIKPIVSIHLPQQPTKPVLNGTTTFRQGRKVVAFINQRHTYHADNDCDSGTRFSSASEEGSTLSTGSSKDGEDIQINRFLLKP